MPEWGYWCSSQRTNQSADKHNQHHGLPPEKANTACSGLAPCSQGAVPHVPDLSEVLLGGKSLHAQIGGRSISGAGLLSWTCASWYSGPSGPQVSVGGNPDPLPLLGAHVGAFWIIIQKLRDHKDVVGLAGCPIFPGNTGCAFGIKTHLFIYLFRKS